MERPEGGSITQANAFWVCVCACVFLSASQYLRELNIVTVKALNLQMRQEKKKKNISSNTVSSLLPKKLLFQRQVSDALTWRMSLASAANKPGQACKRHQIHQRHCRRSLAREWTGTFWWEGAGQATTVPHQARRWHCRNGHGTVLHEWNKWFLKRNLF